MYLPLRGMALLVGIVSLHQAFILAGQLPALPPPDFPVAAPEKGEFVVEHVYTFTFRRYASPVTISGARVSAPYTTPEHVASAQLSAMMRGDYDAFLTTWSEEARRRFDVDDKKQGRSPAFWVSAWQKALSKRPVRLLGRIETGRFVLVEYELGQIDNVTPFIDTIPTRSFENQGWLATQELSEDPVLINWNGERRQRKVIR
jgi:hypothetical protein